MKKLIALLLALACAVCLSCCNDKADTANRPGIMADGVFYEKSPQPMPAEVDESAIIGYVEFYTEATPTKDGETNISKDLIGAPFARVKGGIAILYQHEWYLCKAETEK